MENAITIQEAVAPETKSFFQLTHPCKEKDRPQLFTKQALVVSMSTYILAMCNNSFNLSNPMNALQSIIIAEDLIRERPEYGIEDLVCIIRMARTGQFGQIYNRVDPAVFFFWVQEYADRRQDAWEQRYLEEKHLTGSPVRDSQVAGLTDKMVRKGSRPPDEKYFDKKPSTGVIPPDPDKK